VFSMEVSFLDLFLPKSPSTICYSLRKKYTLNYNEEPQSECFNRRCHPRMCMGGYEIYAGS
jgi:hypothetical protein